MAKRCEDEFNPWPSFVDIFSSVILVMLLFLLVVLVNLGYYAQFRYKVTYTGSIATKDLVIKKTPIIIDDLKVEEETKEGEEETKEQIKQMQEKIEQLKKTINEQVSQEETEKKDIAEIIDAGKDVASREDTNASSKQVLINSEDYFIITFKSNEIFFDTAIIKELQKFIEGVKNKYGKHKILITAADVQGQASATVAKQISLGRSIGARNLIRKFGYEKKDVRIDLLASTEVKEEINKQNGYLLIRISK